MGAAGRADGGFPGWRCCARCTSLYQPGGLYLRLARWHGTRRSGTWQQLFRLALAVIPVTLVACCSCIGREARGNPCWSWAMGCDACKRRLPACWHDCHQGRLQVTMWLIRPGRCRWFCVSCHLPGIASLQGTTVGLGMRIRARRGKQAARNWNTVSALRPRPLASGGMRPDGLLAPCCLRLLRDAESFR